MCTVSIYCTVQYIHTTKSVVFALGKRFFFYPFWVFSTIRRDTHPVLQHRGGLSLKNGAGGGARGRGGRACLAAACFVVVAAVERGGEGFFVQGRFFDRFPLLCFALLCFALRYFTLLYFALRCVTLLYFTLLYVLTWFRPGKRIKGMYSFVQYSAVSLRRAALKVRNGETRVSGKVVFVGGAGSQRFLFSPPYRCSRFGKRRPWTVLYVPPGKASGVRRGIMTSAMYSTVLYSTS